jgi:hypothetical protein
MAVDNHEYYQTEGNRLGPEAADGPPGSRTRLGEPVSDDMSSRTGSVNFFKKNYFQTFKIFPTASDRVRSTFGDYERCSNTVPPRGREKLQRYGGRQPKGPELQRYGVRQPRGPELQLLWL